MNNSMYKTWKKLTWWVWLILPCSFTSVWQSNRDVSPVQRIVAKEVKNGFLRHSYDIIHRPPADTFLGEIITSNKNPFPQQVLEPITRYPHGCSTIIKVYLMRERNIATWLHPSLAKSKAKSLQLKEHRIKRFLWYAHSLREMIIYCLSTLLL